MKKIELDGRPHARKKRLVLLRNEWDGHRDGTVMWSPMYGEVRIDNVGDDDVQFVDGRGRAHSVDGGFKARVGEDVTTAEEMLRPDMDRSVLWDYVGAEYIELKASEGADMAAFDRSIDAWTGVPARPAEALELWQLAKRARDYGDSRPCLLVKPSRQEGVLYVLDCIDDTAAYDWVEGHCRKAALREAKPRRWRVGVELRKTYCVAVEADTEEDAEARLKGMGDAKLLDLIERHATGWDCEPAVLMYSGGEAEEPEEGCDPDWDMDLDEALEEEGE